MSDAISSIFKRGAVNADDEVDAPTVSTSVGGQLKQAAPDTHIPCLDWIDTQFPRFICPHCNQPALKANKKKSAYYVVCYTSAQVNEVFRVTGKTADEIAVLLATGQLRDGHVVTFMSGELVVHQAQPAEYGLVNVTGAFLATNFDKFRRLPEGEALIFRMSRGWSGLAFLHYHPHTVRSAVDMEASVHGYSTAKLDELQAAAKAALG